MTCIAGVSPGLCSGKTNCCLANAYTLGYTAQRTAKALAALQSRQQTPQNADSNTSCAGLLLGPASKSSKKTLMPCSHKHPRAHRGQWACMKQHGLTQCCTCCAATWDCHCRQSIDNKCFAPSTAACLQLRVDMAELQHQVQHPGLPHKLPTQCKKTATLLIRCITKLLASSCHGQCMLLCSHR